MPEVPHEALAEAIHNLHSCDSIWVAAVPVTERLEGETVWDGEVQVFDLVGHPSASRCYAWSRSTEGNRRRFVTVLHEGPVDSPTAAVKAAAVQQYRSE